MVDCPAWDSSLVVFLSQMSRDLHDRQIQPDLNLVSVDVTKLLHLREPSKADSKIQSIGNFSFIFRVFTFCTISFVPPVKFWGKFLLSLLNLFIGRSHMRLIDLVKCCRDCGALALPIITLISFLTGLTMAFVGSIQLQKFNAVIYTADLVCLAMVREMGGLMVGIVMSGRTGAAFAAEIGSMILNEEVDSLRTFGVPAMEFLVLPRVLALFIMTPLLTLYADFVGIIGGLTVGVQIMDFSASHYIEQTQAALSDMWDVYSGLLKSMIFGLVIGLVGCFKGLNTGSNSSALGKSVTSAVVISITFIVICDASFEAIFNFMGLR